MAEIKGLLKQAKNAIKDKYYDEAIQHCKAALKLDKKNYMAMVMFGKASQELKKYQESKKILTLASQVEPDNPIAWQGLDTLLDIDNKLATPEEAIVIYGRNLDIVKEDEKIDVLTRKLATVHQAQGDVIKAADVMRKTTSRLEGAKLQDEMWKSIVEIMSSYVQNMTDEQIYEYLEALEHVLNESVLGSNESNYQNYLRLLYRTNQSQKLANAAITMSEIFPTTYPLEWIARVYAEDFYNNENNGETIICMDVVETKVEKLLSKKSLSQWGNIAKGCLLWEQGEPLQAKKHVRKGAEGLSTNLTAWLLLLRLQEYSKDWPGVDSSCKRIQESFKDSIDDYIAKEIPKKHALALIHIGKKDKLKKAIELLDNVKDKSLETQILIIKTRLILEDTDTARDEITKLEELHPTSHDVHFLKALYHQNIGDILTATTLLEEFTQSHSEHPGGHVCLGKLYYTTGLTEKALICFLRAAKLDQRNPEAFLYLGHHYRNGLNIEKALKCYEKAYALDPTSDEVGASLSDIYRQLGNHEANLTLLENVTKGAGPSTCGWAWLRYGLHHLERRDFQEAVYTLQCAAQINLNDSVTLGCLGDAYFERGSLNAALKVYTKASELNPDDLYPLCQIATIKHLTGELLESINDFKKVIKSNPSSSVSTVAFTGLGEVLLTRARNNLVQYLHSNVKDDCVRAIKVLTRVAMDRPHSLSVWKSIGDACTLLYDVPPSMAEFKLPKRLVVPNSQDGIDVLVSVDQVEVLAIGARCYGFAVELSGNESSFWHDLGVSLYLQGHLMSAKNQEEGKGLLSRAIDSIKRSLSGDPDNPQVWNSLGVMACHGLIKDLKLGQHAFITSLDIQASPAAWTHLGALYMIAEETFLAHEAFSQAQALDPSFVACWVGQALVAESMNHPDMFGLYRHTALLGIHKEGCIGFGNIVTKDACDHEKQDNIKAKDRILSFIPTASDCLVHYTRDKEQDLVGLNLCGITLEMMGLYHSAFEIYKRAEGFLDSAKADDDVKLYDAIRCNYGRVLTKLNKPIEAMEQYRKITEPDVISHCGMALASIKAGQFEDAYNGYTSTLNWIASDDKKKSGLLVALACLQYKFQNHNATKTLLFESTHMSNAAVEGIFALAALGLLSGDAVLLSAALAELTPYEDNPKYCHHVALLRASRCTAMGDIREAKLILSRAIHKHPSNPSIWRSLAQHLLNFAENTPLLNSLGAQACSKAALTLSKYSREHRNDIKMDIICFAMGHLLEYKNKDKINPIALKEAQRAVLMCPGSPEAWATLLTAKKSLKMNNNMTGIAQIWSKKSADTLSNWFKQIAMTVP